MLQLRRGFSHEKAIELFEFAPLALPAEPALFALAPRALAMKEKETSCAVPLIQLRDSACDDFEIFRVFRHVTSRRVSEIT